MKGFVLCSAMLAAFLFICSCMVGNPVMPEYTPSQFAERVNASQSYFDQMVRDDPRNATAWCIRGMYYNDAFGQYENALQSYDRGLELDPMSGLCWYSKGITLQNMRRFDEAKACLERARELDPNLPVKV